MNIVESKMKEVKEYLANITHLNNAVGLAHWDMAVGMPKKALDERTEMIGYLSNEIFKMNTSSKIKEFIDFFSDKMEGLSFVDRRTIEELKKDYDKLSKIPADRNKEYVMLCAKSEIIWEEAKENNDFESFIPYLEQIISFTKEFAGYIGYQGNIYNFCLDEYEPGLNVELTDKVFAELRDGILKLLEKIKKSGVQIDTTFFNKFFAEKDQDEFGKLVLEKLGFDFEAGRLDISAHPFTTNFGNKDVRITTHYDEHDFRSAFFSDVHEGGHGIYEQNVSDDLLYTGLQTGVSMGIHESQSRYYENILGRSREFWSYLYPEAKKQFPQFCNVGLNHFYKGINKVEPSLIRIEADELTYSLHIIIRYEIERAFINGEVEVKDLPELWNKKYKEYLGIEPKDYSDGVLQDVHWSAGLIGYFPSYALGNVYGAQFVNKMKAEIPELDEKIKNGEFGVIKNWLKDNIHVHGKLYSPMELIKRATGEELNPKYFLEYLNKKYSEIYNLK